ncbi:MAG: biotin/lipoyl-binding protein, partial [Phycisphaerae bacterium]
MLRKLFLSLTLLVTGFGIWQAFGATARQKPESPDTVTPAISDVGALGRIEPQSEVIRVNAPSVMEPAQIQELLVRVGDRVTSGQLLAILDSQNRNQAKVTEARAADELAKRSLERVQAGAKSGDITS